MNEEWVTMTEAAERLRDENIQIGRNKISRLASRGIIKTKDNPLDARVRLVNLHELREIFKQFGSRMGVDDSDDET